MWTVTQEQFGLADEPVEVKGANVGEAMANAIEALGTADNDSAIGLTFTINGEADADDNEWHKKITRPKKNPLQIWHEQTYDPEEHGIIQD